MVTWELMKPGDIQIINRVLIIKHMRNKYTWGPQVCLRGTRISGGTFLNELEEQLIWFTSGVSQMTHEAVINSGGGCHIRDGLWALGFQVCLRGTCGSGGNFRNELKEGVIWSAGELRDSKAIRIAMKTTIVLCKAITIKVRGSTSQFK